MPLGGDYNSPPLLTIKPAKTNQSDKLDDAELSAVASNLAAIHAPDLRAPPSNPATLDLPCSLPSASVSMAPVMASSMRVKAMFDTLAAAVASMGIMTPHFLRDGGARSYL